MKFFSSPVDALAGQIGVAADKSISHRMVILGSIAQGRTRVSGLLESEDVFATMTAFRDMGVAINRVGPGDYEIQGVGLAGLMPPEDVLDLGNSGTAFRLLTGLLAGQPWPSQLVGDASLSERPMNRIIRPLEKMGASICARDGRPPLTIHPVSRLEGIHYTLPVASAQVKSCLLLAGLYAQGETVITERIATRDHTERMLQGWGYPVQRQNQSIRLGQNGVLHGGEFSVPADLSSSAFFMVAGLVVPDSELRLTKVGVNPTRNGVLAILSKMGGSIECLNETEIGGEPVADLLVKSSSLKGCDIGGEEVALAIDEIPAVAIAAGCAEGVTRIRGAKELRVKESDRIRSIVNGLRALGVTVQEYDDGLDIEGGRFSGGQVSSEGDHRIAMAFSVAGAVASDQVEILDCANVATSFPDFRKLANRVGMTIDVC